MTLVDPEAALSEPSRSKELTLHYEIGLLNQLITDSDVSRLLNMK